MRRKSAMIVVICLAIVVGAFPVGGQQTTRTTTFQSQPSPFSVRQDILSIKQAQIERQIDIAIRCIRNAQLQIPGTRATINRVPLRDLERCTRKLNRLTRQLEKLGKRGAKLSRDIEALILFQVQQATELQALTNR